MCVHQRLVIRSLDLNRTIQMISNISIKNISIVTSIRCDNDIPIHSKTN